MAAAAAKGKAKVGGRADGESGNWLRSVSARLRMYLHPQCASSLESSVHEVLNSMLFKYDSHFDGVMLAYFDTQILKFAHKILPLLPFFAVRLKAEFLLFSPKAGMIIEGTVNKIEKDYIGMLVLGLFNAAVGANDIREQLYYDESYEQAWISDTEQQHCIKIGTRVAFLVKSVQEEDEFIDIAGSLVPPNTGALDWLVEDSDAKMKERPVEDGKQVKVQDQAEPSNQKKHKKRKRKREDE